MILLLKRILIILITRSRVSFSLSLKTVKMSPKKNSWLSFFSL